MTGGVGYREVDEAKYLQFQTQLLKSKRRRAPTRVFGVSEG